ncbi:PucR family transcriptional regulator [Nocardia vaccinii]|uniref:PucR family transcriptional regulator n=1 Tax=Nocardia vaccinii TaxID=1822 RepID=UPI00082D42B1|nr:helix-turn-helix domain-containing protein [Nocardia vaccinii]
MSAQTAVVVRQWIADFVAETLRTETLDQVVDRLDAAIIGQLPELADRDMRHDLAASTRAHAMVMLGGLTQDRMDYPVPPEAHAFARTVARRGHDLRLLLRVYYLGQEAVLDYLTETLENRHPPPDIERSVLLRLFERSSLWVSSSVEALTGTYMQERERGLRAALNQRTEIVRALLAGADPDVDATSARLGYRLSGRHIACVLWTDEHQPRIAPPGSGILMPGVEVAWLVGDADPAPADPGDTETFGILDRVVARLAAALGGGALTVPSGASALWAWIGVDSDVGLDRLPDVVEPPVRLAVGGPAAHITGFRESHREAMAARQVAERAVSDLGRILRYPEVEVAYLVGADEAAMRALIDRELGALARPGVNAARLRETLHAYLRCRRSPDATAKELGVHRNTVRYRLQRITELLGRPIEERGLHLELALDCAAVYGVQGHG